MSQLLDVAHPAAATPDLPGVLAAELAPLVNQIDEGLYPADAMRRLGEAGVFSHHLARSGGQDLAGAITAMAEVAAVCMSTAFCTWCQDACGWYLENTDNTALRDRLQPGIATGALLGGTGLSNPIKALAGMERFALRATRVSGGFSVTGVLPWVSNLSDGHWLGTVFEDADNPAHRMMAMVQCGQPGVEIRQNVKFSTLEGTGTYSVRFRRAFIADEMMLAEPLGDMVARIRPGFVLLQTGMGLGVIRASIDAMVQADQTHAATNRFLPRRPDYFEAELASQQDAILTLAATPRDGSPDYVRLVLEARLRVGELTLQATEAAMLHTGARAFIVGAPVQRRLREGYFVAMITPSSRHLTQELSRVAAN
ncbi:acyl-CoA dehydrogenase family protein [Acidisphaera sp. L21]|uniref:acyl-CoA dehydrogenase family protein n=1 Tax=Acidisphaera sp. L21 TaxID=1641851 RepID=UPI00131B88DA|nr:acyl-CoA dehydrogenase family protein [Acidisphaera sp. L21]